MIMHNNYENKISSQILDTFSHYQHVNYAFYCSKEIEHLFDNPRVIDYNFIVERWLKGDKTVNLELAKNNALNAWCTAAYAAASCAYTAAVAAAYYAVAAAASSADAAYCAAYCAANFAASVTSAYCAVSAGYYAARAKSYNLCPNNCDQRTVAYDQFFNEYNQIAQNWLSYWNIPNFPKEESDFPIFDFLQDYNLISYLLPKKEHYYYLNLNGFDIKHENEAELLKLIDTVHVKKIIRRIINNAEAQQV